MMPVDSDLNADLTLSGDVLPALSLHTVALRERPGWLRRLSLGE